MVGEPRRAFSERLSALRLCPTTRGNYGLPYQVEVLNAHGLTGVFFVEPLFSTRFGPGPLAEIVGLLREGAQDVELHLHTEWVDEAREPLLPDAHGKRQHLRYFTLDEQLVLISLGVKLIEQSGGGEVSAFRAGSFAFNRDTLRALSKSGIPFDSSYNASQFGADSGVMTGLTVVEPIECEGVHEYPMTVFDDGSGSCGTPNSLPALTANWREPAMEGSGDRKKVTVHTPLRKAASVMICMA
jgi:hypothetical protein